MRVLICDMTKNCLEAVTHIDEDGFVYCEEHGIMRRQGGWKRCRKLRLAELKKLMREETIRY